MLFLCSDLSSVPARKKCFNGFAATCFGSQERNTFLFCFLPDTNITVNCKCVSFFILSGNQTWIAGKSSIYRGFVVIYIYIYRGFPEISPWLLKKVLHDAWELHQGSLDTAGVLNTQEPGSGNSNGTCGFQALEITYFLWLEIRVRKFHRSDDLLNELKGIFGDTVEMRIDASQKCSQLVQDWACVAIPYPQPFRCCCLFPISFNTIMKHSENRANLWYPHRKPHRTPLMGVNHNSFLAIDITPNYGSSLWFQQIMMRFPFHGDIRFIFDLICIIFIYTYLLFYIWLYNCKD